MQEESLTDTHAAHVAAVAPTQPEVRCPECDGAIGIPDNARLSEIVVCSDCSAELEIIALDPIVLALAPEIEEDWGE